MEAMLGLSLYTHLYLKTAKCYAFLIISYVFSSTKLEKQAEQVLPGSEGVRGQVTGGKDGSNNIYTYE
jgi:hypothetical protein